MYSPRSSDVIVLPSCTHPDETLVSLYRDAFPHHPVSRLDPRITAAFLQAYASNATFLVAQHARTAQTFGFAIGGLAAQLERIRFEFIRKHLRQIAAASLRSAPLRRLLLARMRMAAPVPPPRYAYQLRFIAVEPQMRGAGVGSLLIEAFEATLPRESGYHVWTLTGDHGAERFYETRGFARDLAVNGHVRMLRRVRR